MVGRCSNQLRYPRHGTSARRGDRPVERPDRPTTTGTSDQNHGEWKCRHIFSRHVAQAQNMNDWNLRQFATQHLTTHHRVETS